ncbi:Gfo/Idh/MocA family oxidoreductase [Paenibacillus sp. MWE-103]|uniref:Gfo/Idh/MocA family oxidoreductase n=1 Tax=Paenibacillus artemisiicola TaxID=1172618 RepID=A0ABS3WEH2_9BACL|nr:MULTISPECIES: Gfo/Idh/MocA family oxidoreductase [Paenibacillus]MBO7746731.1 Gfo/Idh/MocA family oxidoreductase [Paenibacillus artemisiicola]SFJ76000.1 Predicted dehydrogenase [Paenibacillus sp. UNC496MF]
MARTALNVGMIGLGEVAQVIHLPVLQSLADRFRVTALCDISPRLVEHLGQQYNVENRYTNMADLVKQPDIDVVFILNSDEYHAECAIEAIRHGKHVFMEKPMCLTAAEADAIITERDRHNVTVMVGYMRRYAASFTELVKEIGGLDQIAYARVRDIIGPNGYFIRPTSPTVAFDDIPKSAKADRAARSERLGIEATGLEPSSPLFGVYRFLTGLGSHDLSAMREALGMPLGVVGAKVTQQPGSIFLTAIFDYGRFSVTYETGMDQQGRFDAHIEVYASRKSVKVQYDTPYIRHLPTKLFINETEGEQYKESVIRPTLTDPYTLELNELYEVLTEKKTPKTTPEDYKNDLRIFGMIMDSLK